jgi:hypothetical protein
MAASLALFIRALLIVDAPEKMNNQVESALERPATNITVTKEMNVYMNAIA